MCTYASPALDIINFFSTSLTEDVYQEKRDYLVKLYLETLKNTMDRLGSKTKAPSMGELEEALQDFAIYGLLATFIFRPMIMSKKEDLKDLNEVMESGESLSLASLRNPEFRKLVVNRLPIFDEMGLFE